MNLFNKKIAKHSLEPYCVIVTGDRGVGKSTLFALIVEAAKKEGLDVFCQFPYKDCYQIPLTYITGLCKMNSSSTSSAKTIYTYLLQPRRMMVLT